MLKATFPKFTLGFRAWGSGFRVPGSEYRLGVSLRFWVVILQFQALFYSFAVFTAVGFAGLGYLSELLGFWAWIGFWVVGLGPWVLGHCA